MNPIPSPLAFPEYIGCGLAGGDWGWYLGRILDFAGKHPEIEIWVVNWRDAPPRPRGESQNQVPTQSQILARRDPALPKFKAPPPKRGRPSEWEIHENSRGSAPPQPKGKAPPPVLITREDPEPPPLRRRIQVQLDPPYVTKAAASYKAAAPVLPKPATPVSPARPPPSLSKAAPAGVRHYIEELTSAGLATTTQVSWSVSPPALYEPRRRMDRYRADRVAMEGKTRNGEPLTSYHDATNGFALLGRQLLQHIFALDAVVRVSPA